MTTRTDSGLLCAVQDHSTSLLILATASVAVLVALIAWLRVNAFLALLLGALVMGLGSGMAPGEVVKAFQTGMGSTLGGIAGVLGLGTMLGGLLAASGGAEVLAKALIKLFGPKRVHWCLMALGLCVGLTSWFAVGLVMLVPILLTLAKETKEPFLKLAIPLLAVLSIMHGVMPPHPGPLVAIKALDANLGKVMLWGLLAAIPVAAISGPIFARWAVKHVEATAPEPPAVDPLIEARQKPTLGWTVLSLAIPILLLLSQTAVEVALTMAPESVIGTLKSIQSVTSVIGDPTIALGISVIFAGWAFGFTRQEALSVGERSMAVVGVTLLVVGGGGGFKQVLDASGAARAIGDLAAAAHLPPLVFGWVCAALVRVATGSATVAIITASSMVAPLVVGNTHVNHELVVVGIGCGSLFLSHLNDGGFWIVKETLGLSVSQTLRTWTVTETLVGITGLFVAWGLSMVF
ncbi:MAG: Gluconate:H+ symporter, GntP family [Verrucomicrobiaceae bacterium]|nr:Gluconate:H+ symporter, GntP family [Verrucomicrobiaceae bacterium]